MPPSRGYHSYRGRASKLKIALAVLLSLVIFASLCVMAMSRYISYDEDGLPFFRLPEQPVEPDTTVPPLEEDLNVEIIIQTPEPEPEPEPPVRALSLPEGKLTAKAWTSAAMDVMLDTRGEYNAVAMTMANKQGSVYFDAVSAASGTRKELERDTSRAMEAIAASSLHTIARMSGGQCKRVAQMDVTDMGLKNTGGYIFYDLFSGTWLDPAKPIARQYVCSVASELATLGFDEILLTDMGYPTRGKLDKIRYTGSEVLYENVELLLQELQTVLEGREVLLSIELPEAVVLEGLDETAGLRLEGIVSYVDRIYVSTTTGQVEALKEAVAAVSETVQLVPELAARPGTADEETGYLVLP